MFPSDSAETVGGDDGILVNKKNTYHLFSSKQTETICVAIDIYPLFCYHLIVLFDKYCLYITNSIILIDLSIYSSHQDNCFVSLFFQV